MYLSRNKRGSLTISTFYDTFSHAFLMKFANTTYRLVFFASLIWCFFILSAPIAHHLHASTVADFIYGFFSRICHQLDSRSFHLFNAKLAVCARCTAIYYGFFLSVAFYPLLLKKAKFAALAEDRTRSPWILLFSVLPVLSDVLLSEIGIHESTLITRAVTGVIFCIALPPFLLPLAQEGFKELRLELSLSLRRKIRHAE